jgi:polyvinyl alcohol dehydrogenase (cytochrome)
VRPRVPPCLPAFALIEESAYGGSMDGAGPAIVNGMVFANSGYNQWDGVPRNARLAFSANGQ